MNETQEVEPTYMLVRSGTIFQIRLYSVWVHLNPFVNVIITGTLDLCIDTLKKLRGQS